MVVFSHITAGYFSNSVSETLGKYQFNDPPYITLNGIIDTKDNQETSIVFTLILLVLLKQSYLIK